MKKNRFLSLLKLTDVKLIDEQTLDMIQGYNHIMSTNEIYVTYFDKYYRVILKDSLIDVFEINLIGVNIGFYPSSKINFLNFTKVLYRCLNNIQPFQIRDVYERNCRHVEPGFKLINDQGYREMVSMLDGIAEDFKIDCHADGNHECRDFGGIEKEYLILKDFYRVTCSFLTHDISKIEYFVLEKKNGLYNLHIVDNTVKMTRNVHNPLNDLIYYHQVTSMMLANLIIEYGMNVNVSKKLIYDINKNNDFIFGDAMHILIKAHYAGKDIIKSKIIAKFLKKNHVIEVESVFNTLTIKVLDATGKVIYSAVGHEPLSTSVSTSGYQMFSDSFVGTIKSIVDSK
jgi:hypothetical protein